MFKKVILFVVLLNLYLVVQAVPPIYPVTLDMQLNNGRGNSKFTVFNTGKEKKRYKISIREVDNLGEESLLSKHLKVFPKYIEVDPGNKQVVRVLVKEFPVEDVVEGEYRASISIEELDSELGKKYQSKEEKDGISTNINFKYKVNMAVYGYVGRLIPKITLEEASLDNGNFDCTMVNTGNYSYSVKYQLLDKQGKILEEASLPKLMWNKRKKMQINIPEECSLLRILEGKKNFVLYENDLKF